MLNQIIKPMEPVTTSIIKNKPECLYQIKWDGIRLLAFIDKDKLLLQTRNGNNHSSKYPELRQLPSLCQSRNAIIDGELIVLDKNGKPSFTDIIQRVQMQNQASIRHSSHHKPVTYAIFDVLYADDSSLVNQPLVERQQLLSQLLNSHSQIHLVESFANGEELFAAVCQNKMEGVVVKEKASKYYLGQKHSAWQKAKCWRSQSCVIGGICYKEGRLVSLLAGAYSNDALIYIGSVSAGLNTNLIALLDKFAKKRRINEPQFVNPPRSRSKHLIWLPPLLTVSVEYIEWTPDRLMRSPRIINFGTGSPWEAVLNIQAND